nr:MAG: hypothetical protein [Bacteriophage sp.]
MSYRKTSLIIDGYDNDITVEIGLSEKAKISEPVINKALMIAMNYLLENLEPTEQESAE